MRERVPQSNARAPARAPRRCRNAALWPRERRGRMACVLRNVRMMTALSSQQVELVQKSWRSVQLVGDTAAEMFYGKLFSLDPELRKLFRNDLRDQGRNLTAMISVAVQQLGKPEKIVVAVRQL